MAVHPGVHSCGRTEIRLATVADLPAIFDIYDEQVLHGLATFDTVCKTEAERRGWFEGHPAAEYPAFVAEIEGRVVGWASLSRWSDRRAYDRTAEVSEYVHKDFRGRGIGRALLRTLIDSARGRGRKVLLARVGDVNTGSVRYHEQLGFTTVGIMHGVGEKFGQVLDVRLMERAL
ncbi:MAG: N-acetyltransferase [Phycisphaerales bacterium]|nr:N-acetyltransferase [Phycisphaerales bacterium]